MGGRLNSGLGAYLSSKGYEIEGRELVGDFIKLSFQQQVDLVAEDLKNNYWHSNAHVIANSFGAYLFLHAQAQMDPYVGKVLLLSPIVGAFSNEETLMGFIPPRADKLMKLAKAGNLPIPNNCEIHVGSEDWQSNPANVIAFGSMLGIEVTVVPNAGHMLPKGYVGDLFNKWINFE